MKKKNPSGYKKVMNMWRDFVPHTGKEDIFLGSPKFDKWLEDNPNQYHDLMSDIYKEIKWYS